VRDWLHSDNTWSEIRPLLMLSQCEVSATIVISRTTLRYLILHPISSFRALRSDMFGLTSTTIEIQCSSRGYHYRCLVMRNAATIHDVSQNVQPGMTDRPFPRQVHRRDEELEVTKSLARQRVKDKNVGRPGTCPVVPPPQARGCIVSTLCLPVQYSTAVTEMVLGSLTANYPYVVP
jgi:hypothetical protein